MIVKVQRPLTSTGPEACLGQYLVYDEHRTFTAFILPTPEIVAALARPNGKGFFNAEKVDDEILGAGWQIGAQVADQSW